MKDGLARLGVFDAVGADDVDADGSRKTQVKTARGLVFSPHLSAEFLQWFLELKGVSMDRNLKLANGMAAGEVADGVSGQEEDECRHRGRLCATA